LNRIASTVSRSTLNQMAVFTPDALPCRAVRFGAARRRTTFKLRFCRNMPHDAVNVRSYECVALRCGGNVVINTMNNLGVFTVDAFAVLLRQMSCVTWSVCLSICLSIYLLDTWLSSAKRLKGSRCRLGSDLRGPKEPRIR